MSLFHPIRSECGIGSFNQMSKCVCVCVYIYICIQTQYISTVWSDIVCERMKTNHSSLDTANDREGAGSHRNNVLQPKLQMLAGQCPRLHHRKPGRCAFCSIMFHPILVVLMISDGSVPFTTCQTCRTCHQYHMSLCWKYETGLFQYDSCDLSMLLRIGTLRSMPWKIV
jgi:hypothetical protein